MLVLSSQPSYFYLWSNENISMFPSYLDTTPFPFLFVVCFLFIPGHLYVLSYKFSPVFFNSLRWHLIAKVTLNSWPYCFYFLGFQACFLPVSQIYFLKKNKYTVGISHTNGLLEAQATLQGYYPYSMGSTKALCLTCFSGHSRKMRSYRASWKCFDQMTYSLPFFHNPLV